MARTTYTVRNTIIRDVSGQRSQDDGIRFTLQVWTEELGRGGQTFSAPYATRAEAEAARPAVGEKIVGSPWWTYLGRADTVAEGEEERCEATKAVAHAIRNMGWWMQRRRATEAW